MNKITIPVILLGVIMIAGAIAFMPVEQATLTHLEIQERGTQFITVTATATTNNDDFIITCPATSDGCQIVEVYLDDDAINITIDPGDVRLDLDGTGAEAAFITAADSGVATVGEAPTRLANLAGTTLIAGSTLRIEMTPSAATSAYTLTVIAESEALNDVTVARIAN